MTLKEKLDAMRQRAETKMRPEVLAIMHRATEDLRQSGVLDHVRKPGDEAPEFSLPNAAGKTISSADLLARGPLVVSFYRGVW